jgi:hypothetical protein
VFEYKRPLAATAINNNGTAIVSWSNGSIPSIYYQLIDVNTGAFINTEQRLTSQYDGLKQRNQVVSHLQSVEGSDFGFIISWDNQDLDLSGAGVYQQLIGYDHSIMRFEDGNNNIIFNHAGQMGIGTYTPTATLHIHAPPTTAFNNPANPATLTLQNTATHIITPTNQQSISFLNGSGAQLGSINITNSLRYNDLYPQPDNLIGFYKFDQTEGTQVPDSSSSSINNYSPQLTYVNTNGILVNFDVENCWVAGLINNALAFNGDSNYVFVESTATNGLNTVLESYSKQMSISVWVNVGSNVVVGSTMDIVSNGGDLSLPGGYLLSLQAAPLSSDLYVFANIVVDTIPPSPSSVNISVQSTTQINDGMWHLINMTADVSGTSSNLLSLYIDGNLENSSAPPFTNTLAYVHHSSVATTIGIRTVISPPDTYFRGYMDELRFYNSVLSQSEITQLYTYGSQQLGSVIIAANGHNNINLSQVIDDTGKFNNLNCKPLPYSVITGQITAYRENTNITGLLTQFTKELAPGDIIILGMNALSNREYTIMSVISDTDATLNVPGYDGPEDNKTYQSILRKPNIFSFFDNGDNIQGYINSYGNLTLGNGTSTSKLEIVSSTDNVNTLPELTITNTDQSDIIFARKTAINFAGYDAKNPQGPSVNLAQIAVSHYNDNINDNSGIMQISINDGTSVLHMQNPVISVTSNGNVGIGTMSNPLAQLHLIQRNPLESCTMMLESKTPYNNAIFDEKSAIYFAGVRSITETLSVNVNDRALSAICGSNDSNTSSLDGRIDIMTNNLTNNTNGLESRMSITSVGNVGIGIQQPINTFQVGPQLRIGDNVNIISTVTAQYTIVLDQNIFFNYDTPVKRQYLIGATVVVGTATLTTAKITAILGNNSMTVDTDFTDYVDFSIYISLAGLNASSSGFVGINTTSPNTALHVNGGLSLGIYNTSDSIFDLAGDNSIVTLVCNTTSNLINVYLPNTITQNLVGRIFFFKVIGSNGLIINIAPGDTALIDVTLTATPPVYFISIIQCDGENWWILA